MKGTNGRYAVSVVKDDVIVGHLPRVISRFFCCHLLVSVHYKRNGRIIFIAKKCSCVLISQPYKKFFLTPKFSQSTVLNRKIKFVWVTMCFLVMSLRSRDLHLTSLNTITIILY